MFGLECIVTGLEKLLRKVFKDCEKKEEQRLVVIRNLSAQCKRKFSC